MDLLNKVKDAASSVEKSASRKKTDSAEPTPIPVKLFSFETIDLVICAARLIAPMYQGANTLYRDSANDMYLLALTPSEHTKQEFSKVCNMLSEFGAQEKQVLPCSLFWKSIVKSPLRLMQSKNYPHSKLKTYRLFT